MCAQVFPQETGESVRAPKVIQYSDLDFDRVIGSGGFGEVWLGIYRPTNKKVAIKKIRNSELSEDAKSEIKLHASLDHKFLLPFVGFTNVSPFCIVTEYIPNGSLYDALHAVEPSVQLSPTDLTIIAYGIANGMEYIHGRNIIHMDLKTLNILLDSQLLPKISDFGISSNITNKKQTEHQDIGTAAIMAPELHRYEKFDQSVDVYSFGIILWEMLTHDVPFADKEPMQIVYCVSTKGERPPLPGDVPIPLMKLINACWAEDPKIRPSFHEISNKFLSGEVSFKGSDPNAFRRYIENFGIAKLSSTFISPTVFTFPDSSLLPPSSLISKSSGLLDIQFEVQPMTIDEVVQAMSVPDHPKFEDALDYVEEHLNVIDELGEHFWEVFLPTLLSNHYKAIDRIAKILVVAAKKRSILKHIVKIPNPYNYLSAKTLELFLYVITFYPEIIDSMFVMHMQIILLKSQGEEREHALSLIIKIMQYSPNDDLRVQIVEFLLSAAEKFIDENCGKIALKAIVEYRPKQIVSQDVVLLALKYLRSSIPDNIVAGYQALFCFPGEFKLPLELVYEHILRKEKQIVDLGIEAIRISLHIDDIEEVSRTVLALIESFKATKNNRTILLMCALADTSISCGASAIQVFFQEAICSAIFNILDDIATDFLPLLVLLFRVHHLFFMNHPLLPRFASSVFRFGDDESCCVLCSMLTDNHTEQDILGSFLKLNAIETLIIRMSNTSSNAVIDKGAGFLKLLLQNQFIPQAFDLIKCLVRQLPNIKKPSVNSIELLEIISRNSAAIPILKSLSILDLLKKLTGIKEISPAANAIVKRLL